jgi:hypothetical protein
VERYALGQTTLGPFVWSATYARNRGRTISRVNCGAGCEDSVENTDGEKGKSEIGTIEVRTRLGCRISLSLSLFVLTSALFDETKLKPRIPPPFTYTSLQRALAS